MSLAQDPKINQAIGEGYLHWLQLMERNNDFEVYDEVPNQH